MEKGHKKASVVSLGELVRGEGLFLNQVLQY